MQYKHTVHYLKFLKSYRLVPKRVLQVFEFRKNREFSNFSKSHTHTHTPNWCGKKNIIENKIEHYLHICIYISIWPAAPENRLFYCHVNLDKF